MKTTGKICILILFILYQSCNDGVKKTSLDKLHHTIPTKDSTKKVEMPIDSAFSESDSNFVVKGDIFTINNIKAYFEISINQHKTTFKSKKMKVGLDFYDFVVKTKNQKILLHLKDEQIPEDYYDIDFDSLPSLFANIKHKRELNHIRFFDVNKDGFQDIIVETDWACKNNEFITYTFDSKKNQFIQNKLFSGTNLVFDKKKNRIEEYFNAGLSIWTASYKNLSKDRMNVEFYETISQDRIKINDSNYEYKLTYAKTDKKGNILKKKKIKAIESPGDTYNKYLERK